MEPVAACDNGSFESEFNTCPNVATSAPVRVYLILDERTTPSNPLGEAVETLLRREDAERFLADVRRDDAGLASHLRIEERELEAGGRN